MDPRLLEEAKRRRDGLNPSRAPGARSPVRVLDPGSLEVRREIAPSAFEAPRFRRGADSIQGASFQRNLFVTEEEARDFDLFQIWGPWMGSGIPEGARLMDVVTVRMLHDLARLCRLTEGGWVPHATVSRLVARYLPCPDERTVSQKLSTIFRLSAPPCVRRQGDEGETYHIGHTPWRIAFMGPYAPRNASPSEKRLTIYNRLLRPMSAEEAQAFLAS